MLRVGAIALAIALALAGGALVFVATGLPVAGSYRTMWNGALGSTSAFAQTLVASTPLILTGLSVTVARWMRVWNFGAEGQLYMGATFATAVGLWYPNWPRPLLVVAMLSAGALGGAAWSLGPALLKVGPKVNEIITTLMLNFVALLLVDFLLHGRWRDPLALGFPLSRQLSSNSTMPALFGSAVHAGLLVALAAALLLWFVPSWSRWGLVTDVTGKIRGASNASISANQKIVLVMLASGALAGIAGMGEVSGVTHRLGTDISANYGYVGILIAALSRFSPLGVAVLAIPFGALLVGGFALRNTGDSAWVVATLQGTMVAIVLASELLARKRRLRRAWSWPIEAADPARRARGR